MKAIVIHCSATNNFQHFEAKDIHEWHQKRGWDGIGYHYVITLDGEIQAGRPEYWQGAHVGGHNEDTIGICLIGMDDFTDSQINSLESLVRNLLKRYPDAEVNGHSDYTNSKTCPNFKASDWWNDVKKSVSDYQ